MLKKAVKQGLIGAPIGVMVCTLITLLISIAVGDGHFYPVPHELIDVCPNEITAAIIQFVCSMLYGAVFGASSVIWQNERWSILRQTVTHLIVISVACLPIAYLLHWMAHTPGGVVGYILMFLVVYAGVWLGTYLHTRSKIKKLNDAVARRK